jgi:hypothetical protein
MATLFSILSLPAPKGFAMSNLLAGKRIDIICTETGDTYLTLVPKQMLIHFLGTEIIGHYSLWTPDGREVLTFSSKHVEYIGLKKVVAWMQSACKFPTTTGELSVPTNDILAACCVMRALRVLGCHEDVVRLHRFVYNTYFRRDLRLEEVKDLWLVLPHNCHHNGMVVENIKKNFEEYFWVPSTDLTLKEQKKLVDFVSDNGELRKRVNQGRKAHQSLEKKVEIPESASCSDTEID